MELLSGAQLLLLLELVKAAVSCCFSPGNRKENRGFLQPEIEPPPPYYASSSYSSADVISINIPIAEQNVPGPLTSDTSLGSRNDGWGWFLPQPRFLSGLKLRAFIVAGS